MPTSSIETREIDAYLTGNILPGESLLFQAKMILQPELNANVQWQQRTCNLLRLYSRQQLKAEIKAAETIVFNDAPYLSFRQKILKLFKR